MSDKPESKYFWADIGPDFDPVYSGNPNENCFTLCVLAEDYDRLRRELTEARGLIEYAYNEMGGAWPAADAFLAEKPNE